GQRGHPAEQPPHARPRARRHSAGVGVPKAQRDRPAAHEPAGREAAAPGLVQGAPSSPEARHAQDPQAAGACGRPRGRRRGSTRRTRPRRVGPRGGRPARQHGQPSSRHPVPSAGAEGKGEAGPRPRRPRRADWGRGQRRPRLRRGGGAEPPRAPGARRETRQTVPRRPGDAA
ncbi:hypothetical protein H4R21_006639, partial [Coemansia helicoidea]